MVYHFLTSHVFDFLTSFFGKMQKNRFMPALDDLAVEKEEKIKLKYQICLWSRN